MKLSKQLSITLAAATLAVGVATLVPGQADASYYYKYTDKRPPVLTPGYMPVAIPATTKTETATTNTATATNTPAVEARATVANNEAPRYSDYNSTMAYSIALGQYFMNRINAMFNGNTALNRYGVR